MNSKRLIAMESRVNKEKEKLRLISKLADFSEGKIVHSEDAEWSYTFKTPFIKLGNISTFSESDSNEVVKTVKTITKGLTSGFAGGYSSYDDDSADWAVITVPLSDLNNKTINKVLKKIRKFCPQLKVKFKKTLDF